MYRLWKTGDDPLVGSSVRGSKFRDLIDDGEKRAESKSFRDSCKWLVSRPQFDWGMGVLVADFLMIISWHSSESILVCDV